MSPERLGALMVLGGTALFGTIGTARVLGPDDAPAPAVAFARMAVASSLMVAIAVATASRRRPASVPALLGSPTLWVAGIGQACFQASFLAAVTRVGVATGTLVAIGATPLLTGLVATVRTRRPTRAWLTSTGLGVLGLVLLVGVGGRADPVGLLVAFGAAVSYATFILAGGALTRHEHPLGTTLPAVFCIATVVLAPAALVSEWAWIGTGEGAVMLLWLATVPTVVAYGLFNRGLAWVDAPVAATLGLIEPLVATGLALLLLGESLAVVQVVGALLVASAMVLAARVPAPAAVPPAPVTR